jgi:hypothetical protein
VTTSSCGGISVGSGEFPTLGQQSTSRTRWAGRVTRIVAYQSPSTVVEAVSSELGAT